MVENINLVIVLLCLLQIKHMLGDYFFQTRVMLEGRADYLHVGRMMHAGLHAFGSLIVFFLIGAPFGFILPVVLAEGVIHYHIDWWKGRYTAQHGLTPKDAGYWRATGVDQALHQLTYAGMIWIWVISGVG